MGTQRCLLIDGTHINQIGLEEDNNQVRLMLDMYEQANEAVIWVSEQRETEGVAIPLAYQIWTAAQPLGASEEWEDRP